MHFVKIEERLTRTKVNFQGGSHKKESTKNIYGVIIFFKDHGLAEVKYRPLWCSLDQIFCTE
jgi:hypothetical protein